ncbi:Tumor susceptibility gene 101 protein [Papilio machaon]|uniref:Tumor susceptibility gene 101 protein n=1 Tax=Papilio machaon TaxID=76193 RepID=A0A194R3P8_PAPMA|nr:tumor susceptibility gene 101 protein [Papilio machaon]KPJ10466.1 Tumor susceptibility gene 101 protein [Papilio machaon]
MANDEVVLKQYLSKYKHRDYTAREVISLIQVYRSLVYRLEAFVFNNGTRKDLLNLEGTIPVNYKGAFYNIPVSIWLMDTHPQNAPLCFVKPTPEMTIKTSKWVDSNGKIYLPYLHEWSPSGSTLQRLVQWMITAFGELPPVYAKPRNQPRPPYPFDPFMPQPSGYPYPQVNPQPGYSTATPYPTTSNPLPYPNFGTPYPGSVSTNGTPYPAATPYPPTTNFGPGTEAGGTITEEHIKASLLSAVTDKLRRKLNEQSQQSQAELETLRRTQQELCEGKSRLEDIFTRLQREKATLEKNLSTLQEKEKELEAAVERLAEQDGIEADEAVVTTAPLYSQLLNAFAEEATLEDAIYYMGEALRKEVIDLDTFLKQVRTLARRQFTLRALMHKCRQKAQLAC